MQKPQDWQNTSAPPPVDNFEIASALERIASLLEAQDANVFRVEAYRRAARVIREWPQPLTDILYAEGRRGLERLPGVGKSISCVIQQYVETRHVGLLEHLKGEVSAEDILATVPGIGKTLARKIHQELGISTLEDLEMAAYDGRLEKLAGFGRRRTRAIRYSLAGVLSYSARRRAWRLRQLRRQTR